MKCTLEKWSLRKRGTLIGRLTFVAPQEVERYYLRILLSHIPGPKSFDDLLTIGVYRCTTFHEAALKHGLIEPDDLVEKCLDEAIAIHMPQALRRLFATVLVFLQPSDPCQLWTKYNEYLSEDFCYIDAGSAQLTLTRTYQELTSLLDSMGKSMKCFGLDHICPVNDLHIERTRDVVDALDAQIPKACNDARKLLNNGQRAVYKCIVSHVRNNKSGLFFIDDPGGTGKTFLYCALYAKVRLLNKIVLPTASSGIAAVNLPTRRTAHSRFKIPLDCGESVACNVSKQSSLVALLQETSVIIWDEATMARKENIESLDLLLRDLCTCNEPFGGKTVVLGGDYRQGMSVLPKKTQKETSDYSLVSSALWPLFKRFSLTENLRALEDPQFSQFLLSLGNGQLQKKNDDDLVHIPPHILIRAAIFDKSLDDLMEAIFPEISSASLDSDYFEGRAIWTPMNEDVDAINDRLIRVFHGVAHTYKSFDTTIDDNCDIYAPDFLNTLCPGGMSPHELILKLNSPVILL